MFFKKPSIIQFVHRYTSRSQERLFYAPVFFFSFCVIIRFMNTLTLKLSKEMLREGEVVVLPKKQFLSLVARAEGAVSEKDILRWSREARALERTGKLPVLRSLREI